MYAGRFDVRPNSDDREGVEGQSADLEVSGADGHASARELARLCLRLVDLPCEPAVGYVGALL